MVEPRTMVHGSFSSGSGSAVGKSRPAAAEASSPQRAHGSNNTSEDDNSVAARRRTQSRRQRRRRQRTKQSDDATEDYEADAEAWQMQYALAMSGLVVDPATGMLTPGMPVCNSGGYIVPAQLNGVPAEYMAAPPLLQPGAYGWQGPAWRPDGQAATLPLLSPHDPQSYMLFPVYDQQPNMMFMALPDGTAPPWAMQATMQSLSAAGSSSHDVRPPLSPMAPSFVVGAGVEAVQPPAVPTDVDV